MKDTTEQHPPEMSALKQSTVCIYWRSKETGYIGHGEPISRETAEEWLRYLEPRYPTLNHWIFEV